MNEWEWDIPEEGDAPSDIDQIIELWLLGQDISDMPIWEEWDIKYVEEADELGTG